MSAVIWSTGVSAYRPNVPNCVFGFGGVGCDASGISWVSSDRVPVGIDDRKDVSRKWGEVEVEAENLPSKVTRSVMRIDVNVRVGYINLEGLHDGRAAGNLLPRLNPRKLVLVTMTDVTD